MMFYSCVQLGKIIVESHQVVFLDDFFKGTRIGLVHFADPWSVDWESVKCTDPRESD